MPFPANLAIEVNFEGVSGTALVFDDADRGKFDTGTFGGSFAWVDVTEFVRSASITRGVSRFDGVYGRAEAGRATVVLDNSDARFDPTNTASPYYAGGVTQVQPMRRWRIRADGQPLWYGFADSWDLSYPVGGHDAVCTLTGTDGTKVLANYDGVEQSSQGEGEPTGRRIERVLDNASWPSDQRDLDTGNLTVKATTLAPPAWTEIVLTSDTELGEVYFNGVGQIVFREQRAIMTETRSTVPQGEFSTGGTLPYADLTVSTDDTNLANLVKIARDGGTEQTASDVTSQLRYLKRSFERSDLTMQTDAVALAYAQYVLYLLKDVELRFESLTINPNRDPAFLYPQVLARELGDRITVRWRPPGGAEIVRDCFIRGIAHQMDVGGMWSTTWALQDARRFDYLIIDHAQRGILGANRVAF